MKPLEQAKKYDAIRDRDSPHDGYLARQLPASFPLNDFVAWLTSNILGPASAGWLERFIEKNKINSSQDLMNLLAIKWPRLILSERREVTMTWLSRIVSEDFLLDASPRLFPSLAYQTLLDRPPTEAEAKDATKAAEVEDKESRRKFLQHLLRSEEYRRNPHRRALLPSGVESQATFEARRHEADTLGYRIPESIPDTLFDLRNEADDAGCVSLKGFVCARYDTAYKKLIVDPNVSIFGVGIGGNRFRVARDWIVLGPRATLDAGDYLIVIDVEFEGETEATVDLVSAYGTQRHMSLTFRESLKSIIPVRIDERTHAVELRLLNLQTDSDVMHLNEIGIYDRHAGRHTPAPAGAQASSARAVATKAAVAPTGGVAGLFGRSKGTPKAIYKFISATKEFDRDWYGRQYPDVSSAGVDPLKHFIMHGMGEGRLPNDAFDPIAFVEAHPESGQSKTVFLDYLKDRHPGLARKYF